MKSYLLTVCTGLLLFFSYNASAQQNLVLNGGFEDELFGWDGGGGNITPWDLKSGKKSCSIVTTSASNWVGIYQIVRIPKKAVAVDFSAWLKASHVVKGKDDWNGAVFTIVFLDIRDKEMGQGTNIANMTGDQQWTLSEKIIKIPDKAFSFKILLAMGYASGTMLVDDVAAKVVVE